MDTIEQEKSKKGLFAVVFLIGVFFVLLLTFAAFLIKSLDPDKKLKTGFGKHKGEKIAVVEVEGPIMESKKIIKNLLKAEEDEDIKAIILRVDSPGGAVGPTQEIYDEIVRIDEKKPVWGSFGSIAASGGYYLGAACRKIYANAGTLTGSIGVIMHFMDLSELYQWAKLKPEIIKAGKYKDIGSPHRAMSDEENILMKEMMDGVHNQFKRDIMKRRGDRIVGNIDDLAQGQIFSGEKAKELGLVDEIGGMNAMSRVMGKELGFAEDPELIEVKEKKPFRMVDLFEEVEGLWGQVKYGVRSGPIPLFMGRF